MPSHAEQHGASLLPFWPPRTIAVLATVGAGPHAIPVSAPVRAGDRSILLSLHRARGSLARLRERPRVALLVLAQGDVAFTARGTAQIVADPMSGSPQYAAVEIIVTDVDDHRQAGFTVAAGAGRLWIDMAEQRALGGRVTTLRRLATVRRRCLVAAYGRGGRAAPPAGR